jgi:hypothetical protein
MRDRLVDRIIEAHPKAAPFAMGLQSLLDQGVPRSEVIAMGRTAIQLERLRLRSQ